MAAMKRCLEVLVADILALLVPASAVAVPAEAARASYAALDFLETN